MDIQLADQQPAEKLETALYVGSKTLGSTWKTLSEILRQSDESMIVIKGNNGRIYFRSRLSIALAYVITLLAVRRLRLATLFVLPLLLSRLQFTSDEPNNAPLTEIYDKVITPSKKAKSSTRKNPVNVD